MTGREQVALNVFAEFVTSALTRMETKIDDIDERTRALEQQGAKTAGATEGQAAAVAHANVVNQRIETKKAAWRDSLRTVFAIAAASATIAGVIVGAVLTVLHT